MKYMTEQLLEDLHNQVEKQISKAISEWQQLPYDMLSASPGPGRWSAVQCLEHLNSYGRYYLPQVEKAIQQNQHKKPVQFFQSGWLGNYFYSLMLPQKDGKPSKKMKSPKNHQPDPLPDPAVVLYDFISQLETLGTLLQQANHINLNQVKVPISIAPFIKLKLGDVFLFYTAHISRHMAQAERALEEWRDQQYPYLKILVKTA
jgi:hypothetical protein